MKPLLLAIFLGLVGLSARGQALYESLLQLDAQPAATSYIVRQTFEGTGYDNGETWADTGGPDPDYTGVVLQGSQSWRLNQAGAAMYSSVVCTNNGTTHGYFILRPITRDAGSARRIAGVISENGGTVYLEIRVVNTGTMRIIHGGTTVSTVATVANGTTYHVWWTYTPGTGADGFASLAFSTSAATKPLSGNNYVETTAGTATGQMGAFSIGNGLAVTQEHVFDSVLVDNAVIGESPVY